ncbi:MAG: hypothetical protein R2787_13295 [Saprospiraceae bacterium]
MKGTLMLSMIIVIIPIYVHSQDSQLELAVLDYPIRVKSVKIYKLKYKGGIPDTSLKRMNYLYDRNQRLTRKEELNGLWPYKLAIHDHVNSEITNENWKFNFRTKQLENYKREVTDFNNTLKFREEILYKNNEVIQRKSTRYFSNGSGRLCLAIDSIDGNPDKVTKFEHNDDGILVAESSYEYKPNLNVEIVSCDSPIYGEFIESKSIRICASVDTIYLKNRFEDGAYIVVNTTEEPEFTSTTSYMYKMNGEMWSKELTINSVDSFLYHLQYFEYKNGEMQVSGEQISFRNRNIFFSQGYNDDVPKGDGKFEYINDEKGNWIRRRKKVRETIVEETIRDIVYY